MVYCGFPSQPDRLAILQAVGHKLALAADVSLQDIATQTEGFTGADLAAILSEAQLLAVHDQIDSTAAAGHDASSVETHTQQPQQQEPEQDSAEHGTCVLTAQHVQRALSRARPSLPPTEKQRLQAVYARFQQSRDPGLSNRPNIPEDDTHRVKHATLA
jgi:peroxin-1